MYIIGVILLFILPLAAGTFCKGILRWKETNQIETYLIGFFFLFFMQGLLLVPCVIGGLSFSFACKLIIGVGVAVFVLGLCMLVRKKMKTPKTEEKKKTMWRRRDKLLFAAMMTVFVCLIIRIVLGMDLLRNDIVLETVNTTIQTQAMFTYHPLTGMMMDSGMIMSKKIVTLPLFYAVLVQVFGMNAKLLLYMVINLWVICCSYYACALLFTKVATVSSRGKMYVYWTVYGMLILAGDYHPDTLAYRLLYQGYEGITICFGVLMPYLLYLILSWYRDESDEESPTIKDRIGYVLKIALVFACSMVITGLGTGFLFLFLTGSVAAVCCLLKSIKEVRACKE